MVLRRRLAVPLATAMMLAITLTMAGTAWAKGGCGIFFGGGGDVAKAEGKNNGWGDGGGGGKNHPK